MVLITSIKPSPIADIIKAANRNAEFMRVIRKERTARLQRYHKETGNPLFAFAAIQRELQEKDFADLDQESKEFLQRVIKAVMEVAENPRDAGTRPYERVCEKIGLKKTGRGSNGVFSEYTVFQAEQYICEDAAAPLQKGYSKNKISHALGKKYNKAPDTIDDILEKHGVYIRGKKRK